jgi:membrane-associated phospholipid phosphatase
MFYLKLADCISMLPMNYWGLMVIYYILYWGGAVPYLFSIRYIVGFTSIVVLSEYIKTIIYPYTNLAKRPIGARNSNFLANNGNVEGKPGLPSTHTAIVSYFSTYNFLIMCNTNLIGHTTIFHILNVGILLATGWSRYYKKCHSMTQIVTGAIFGIVYATFFYYF